MNEKNLRMILNFGHTFAHAIEVKNNYSKSKKIECSVITFAIAERYVKEWTS